MKEEITWGKTHVHYKPEFKKYGFTLKVEVERHGYRDVSKGGRGNTEDFSDFWIYINGEYNMHYHGISFDILDCILFGYVNAFRLMEEKKEQKINKDDLEFLFSWGELGFECDWSCDGPPPDIMKERERMKELAKRYNIEVEL